MRNKQLDDLLYSLAYDRGHSAGEGEVNMIHESLRSHFEVIDAQLPLTNTKYKRYEEVIINGAKSKIVEVITEQGLPMYRVSTEGVLHVYSIREEHISPMPTD